MCVCASDSICGGDRYNGVDSVGVVGSKVDALSPSYLQLPVMLVVIVLLISPFFAFLNTCHLVSSSSSSSLHDMSECYESGRVVGVVLLIYVLLLGGFLMLFFISAASNVGVISVLLVVSILVVAALNAAVTIATAAITAVFVATCFILGAVVNDCLGWCCCS